MDRYNAINRAYKDSAASGTTVEQPKEPQAVFEQHLREVRQLGPVYSLAGFMTSPKKTIASSKQRLVLSLTEAHRQRRLPLKSMTVGFANWQSC
ncbi:hypothetical protein [Bradyrhizobium niftali]|jgi:hypothetical protein|uniref:hypothetical protein n=1 Tax=Bradyrhizobium niftali TaxID=2560055 RepID=UPI001F40A4E3|nr:hypothetical protein [Bradyrhizobium niftali]